MPNPPKALVERLPRPPKVLERLNGSAKCQTGISERGWLEEAPGVPLCFSLTSELCVFSLFFAAVLVVIILAQLRYWDGWACRTGLAPSPQGFTLVSDPARHDGSLGVMGHELDVD